MRKVYIILATILATGLALAWWHQRETEAFDRKVAALVAKLYEEAAIPEGGNRPVQPMPEPLASFVGRAAAADRPAGRLTYLVKQGEIRLTPESDWLPMRAEQYISLTRPGFVWIAEVELVPFVTLRIVDSYVSGIGTLEARLFGSVPVARLENQTLDQGELTRYLTELIWAPGGFSRNPVITYKSVDATSVEVSAGTATVRYFFNDSGDLIRIFAPDRPREADGDTVNTPWEGHYGNYASDQGFRLPRHGEELWLLADGPFMYWKGMVTEWRERP